MTFGRLRWRIALVSLACGGLGLAASSVLLGRVALRKFEPALARDLVWRIDARALAACEQAPERWQIVTPGGIRYDAFDATTGQSRNPTAVSLDRTLLHRLQAGEPHPVAMQRASSPWGLKMLVRGRSSGPCGIIQIARAADPGVREAVRGVIIASVWLPIIGALIGLVLILGPILRRIRRLNAAALRVGSDSYHADADTGSDELAAVARALDRAHERIVADTRALEERRTLTERFLEDVAHDLRTPIAALQLSLEELADLCREDSDARALTRGALADVVYAGSLVANLRLASRLASGWNPVEGDPVTDLGEIVARVTQRYGIFARRRGVRLDGDQRPAALSVRGDPIMIEQAVSNLLENAIAYGDDGGQVSVSLVAEQEGFRLVVADDGPGVAPEALPRLGQRAFRSDAARQRDRHGSGLGLAIVAAVCERNGWSLRFANRQPKGLEVTIEGSRGAGPRGGSS